MRLNTSVCLWLPARRLRRRPIKSRAGKDIALSMSFFLPKHWPDIGKKVANPGIAILLAKV
jgi:hypothetical protein